MKIFPIVAGMAGATVVGMAVASVIVFLITGRHLSSDMYMGWVFCSAAMVVSAFLIDVVSDT